MADYDSLEQLICITLFAQLAITPDAGTVEFIVGIIEEASLEPEEKCESIISILETYADDLSEQDGIIEALLAESTAYIDREQAAFEAERQRRNALAKAALAEAAPKGLSAEDEAKRRQDLIKSFGYVEDEDDKALALKAEAAKGPAIILNDGVKMSKKARKKAEAGLDLLMQPNINAALVKGAEVQRRQELSIASAAKRDKDKSDIKNQKDNAAKKAAEKTKKAQKGERRA